MNLFTSMFPNRCARRSAGVVMLGLALTLETGRAAQPDKKTLDDELNATRMLAAPMPFRPPANGVSKTLDEHQEDRAVQLAAFLAAAGKARDFHTKNPAHERVAEAKMIEATALLRAVQLGATAEEPQALRLGREFRADRKNPSRNRYEVAALMTQLEVGKQKTASRDERMEILLRHANNLLGEFPGEPAVYDQFLGIAQNSSPEKARSVVQEILLQPASKEVKDKALAIVARHNLPGKNVAFEWVDDQGSSRRVADYKGKILVFYVWASWAPASAEARRSIVASARQGVEIVSVNVDTDPAKAQAAKAVAAPTGSGYFDSRALQSPLALQLMVDKVPAVHVIDATGKYVGRGVPAELDALLRLAAK